MSVIEEEKTPERSQLTDEIVEEREEELSGRGKELGKPANPSGEGTMADRFGYNQNMAGCDQALQCNQIRAGGTARRLDLSETKMEENKILHQKWAEFDQSKKKADNGGGGLPKIAETRERLQTGKEWRQVQKGKVVVVMEEDQLAQGTTANPIGGTIVVKESAMPNATEEVTKLHMTRFQVLDEEEEASTSNSNVVEPGKKVEGSIRPFPPNLGNQ
ncbi:OLC1v1016488C1 [Oldenlandia corymbosa var. corymbosa]|uniref:OLC1v1016488C1 n=1 Tax=Oldenlandia corymbosa var. corymbosa TaxID=529605 RepID=A0AAV1E7G9_OLDCO|nr:OLC1v1016488C1 [Oldenlandia corymbosa var. corymbosa]